MIATREPQPAGVARFRAKLFAALMVVIVAVTGVTLYFTQRSVAGAFEQELQRDFQAQLAALDNVQQLRDAALAERCRILVRRPRIHAAFEDSALDLLYPSARDELRDIMASADDSGRYGLHAAFYRFLDRHGVVIPPPNARDVGVLTPGEEAQLSLPAAPDRLQLGYLRRETADASDDLAEVIALPIVSNETGEVLAALVLGFERIAFADDTLGSGIKRGLWLNGRLHLDRPAAAEPTTLAAEVARAIASGGPPRRLATVAAGAPHLLFYKQLNPGSAYTPAYEVCVYPLEELQRRQRESLWRILAVAAALLVAGFGASHLLARRFAQPVEALAVDSAQNRAGREKAEAALELTHEELQRAARFSADASHQLKTPVTVLRAGLEELLARENLTPEECHEISTLIHQTYRLSGVIEDLLLLSRMDAGRLTIDFGPVNLSQLIEAALDDLSAQDDELELNVESHYPPDLMIEGEKRYLSLILQNLLENARKYNERGGRVQITTQAEVGTVFLVVGNTGRTIPPAAQEHIFERFHRGAVGENVPGYGLGLNLARQLARLHGGDLRLLRSEDGWTEFRVSFRPTRFEPART